ncbi:hypothetical protein C1645_823171 [Glomus cerebriforme]|uniref:Uncharacterized protein n=1 Tax=Glomus cerebriforme TaxID=658196 RepID=A0A397SWI0_9GLOM|nr:hypothetical protein C1645_823171 [Glomus cerebriforme]
MDRINNAKVDRCCFCVPLRIGAFIVAAWIFIWNLYLGIILLLTDLGSIYTKIVAILYLLVALIAFYGAHVMSLLSVISLSIFAANDKKNCERANPENTDICQYKFSFIGWLINFVIGVIIDVYLYIVIRSYKRELEGRSTRVPPTV